MCIEMEGEPRRLKKSERYYKIFGVCRSTGKLMPVIASIGRKFGPAVNEKGNLIRSGKPRKRMKDRSSFQVFLYSWDAYVFQKAMNAAIMRETVCFCEHREEALHPYLCYIVKRIKVRKGTLVREGKIRNATTAVDGHKGAQISSGRVENFGGRRLEKELEKKISRSRKE